MYINKKITCMRCFILSTELIRCLWDLLYYAGLRSTCLAHSRRNVIISERDRYSRKYQNEKKALFSYFIVI